MDRTYKHSTPTDPELDELLNDISNTRWHKELIEKALKASRAIPDIEAVILKGSLALEQGDIFSDIDFLVVHQKTNEVSTKIVDEFMKALSEIGDVIHIFYSTVNLRDPIIYFKPFIKFELNVRTAEQLVGRWNNALGKVLYDKSGIGKKIIQDSQIIKFDFEKHRIQVQNLATSFPSMCYIVGGYVVRGEYLTALDETSWLRGLMLATSGWLLGQWDEGPRRAEQRFPDDLLDYCNRANAKQVVEVWEALGVLLDWYEKWFVPKLNQLGIQHVLHELKFIHYLLDRMKQISK